MMGLHQNYPAAWGSERLEGLTLDLGLDGMFSPLPTELTPVGPKDSEPPPWRFFGHSPAQPHVIVDDDLDDEVVGGDPSSQLLSSNNNGGGAERKPEMFELSLSYPPSVPRQQQQQLLVHMKLEREDVGSNLKKGRPPLEADLPSHSEGSFNCWRHTADLPPRNGLHLYGSVGDDNLAAELPDDDVTMTDFPEIKQDPCGSSSGSPEELQHHHQHPETIILTDDDSDDEFLFEERYSHEHDGFNGDSSRSEQSQERGFPGCSQSLPLRQIKQQVRLSRGNDEDYNACVTPSSSAVPEMMTMMPQRIQQAGEQGQQQLQPSLKRARGYGDCDWLPSDLLAASHSETQNEAKRARGSNDEHDPREVYIDRLPVDVPSPQFAGSSMQGQNPLIDVNQAIEEMPQDTAEAFKELIRLVGASGARGSRAVDEIEKWRPDSNDVQHSNDPPAQPAASPPSRAATDEIQSRRSVANDEYQLSDSPPPETETVNQPSRLVDDTEGRRSVTTSEFEHNNSSPLATVDQAPPGFARISRPCNPAESASRSHQCSPHRAAYEQQHSGNRVSNVDVVVYEPKQEPVDSWRENMSGSVVHVKQEQLQYEAVPDRVCIRPVVDSTVGSCYTSRKLVLTALDTFEKVRQQILKDPTYGQPILDMNGSGGQDRSKRGGSKRRRADLKAACLMRKKGFWLNERIRPIGEVPGVTVGDCFRYRIEMAVIGLHRAVQAGIAVVPLEYSPYGHTVASSVVIGVSDPYQDDNDMGDTVIYSGQGGLCGKTKESEDQKLQRGNLALNNSFKFKLPVRLIRGHRDQNTKTSILYSYDGLYHIVDMKYVIGVNGKKVYKFVMHRLPGQPPICPGYPAPLGSHSPAREQAQHSVNWTEQSDTKPLYLEKYPVS